MNRMTLPALLALVLLAGAAAAADEAHPDLSGNWVLNAKASDDPAAVLGLAAEAAAPRPDSFRDDAVDPNRETRAKDREEAVAGQTLRLQQRISRLEVFTGGDEFSVSDGLDIFRLLHTDGRTETVWTDAGETRATAVWRGSALEVHSTSGKADRLTRFQLSPEGSQLLVMEQFTPPEAKEPVILRLVYDRQP